MSEGTTLGKAWVQIVPSAKGISGSIGKLLSGEAESAGVSAGTSFGNSMVGAIKGVISAAGIGAATASAAVVAFSADAVQVGQSFDKSMSQVAATMGFSVEQLNQEGSEASKTFSQLRDFAQDMGAKTAFSASQAADALNYMALAGYSADTSMQMLPNVLNLAAAGGMDLAAASDMITDSQSALGLSLDETAALVDKMAKASSKSNTSVSQLGSAILTVGGTAKTMKGGTTELAQVLGIIADNGVKGAEGGTALRNIILSLTAPTDKAAAKLKELGVSALDNSGNMRSMKDIFADLNKSLGNMTEGQKTAVLSEIFNKVDLKSVNALMSTNIGRWDELSGAIDNAAGAAQAMADTQLDNLAGDITIFQSALEGVKIAVSDEITPALRKFVQLGTTGLSDLASAIKENGLAGAMDALGPFIDNAIGMLMEGIPKAVAFGGQLLGAIASGVINNLPKLAEGAAQVVAELGGQLTEAAPEIMNKGAELLRFFTDGILNNIDSMVDAALNVIDGFAGFLADAIPNLAKTATDIIITLALTLSDPGVLSNLTQSALAIVGGIATAIIESLPRLAEAAVEVIANFAAYLDENLPVILEAGLNFLNGFVQGVMSGLPAFIASLPEIIRGFITDNLPIVLSGGVEIIASLTNGILNAIPAMMDAVPEIITAFVDFLTDNLPVIFDKGAELAEILARGLTEGIPAVAQWIATAVTSIANFIVDNGPAMLESGLNIAMTLISGLLDGITEAIPILAGAAIDVITAFASFLWENKELLLEKALEIASELVTAVIGALDEIGNRLAEKIPALSLIFENLETIVTAVVAAFVAYKAAMAITGVIDSVSKAIEGAKAAFALLHSTMMANPFVLIATLVAGIAAALITLWNTNEDFRNAVTEIWEGIKDGIATAWEGIKTASAAAWEFIKGVFSPVAEFFKGIWDAIVNSLTPALEAVKTAFSVAWTTAQGVWNVATEFFSAIWEGIKAVFSVVASELGGFFSSAWEAVNTAWSVAVTVFSGIWEGIKAVFSVVASELGGFFSAAWEAVNTVWSVAVTVFSGIWEGIKAVFSVVASELGGFFSAAWEAVNTVWSVAVTVFSGIWEGIKAVFSVAQTVIGGFFSGAWNAVTLVWNASAGFFKNIWESIVGIFSAVSSVLSGNFLAAWTAIQNVFSGWGNYFQSLWKSLTNVFANVSQWFKNVGVNIVNGIWNGIVSVASEFFSNIGDFVSRIMNMFTGRSGFDEHSPSHWAEGVFRRVLEGGEIGFAKALPDTLSSAEDAAQDIRDALSMDSFHVNGGYDYAQDAYRYAAPQLADIAENAASGSSFGQIETVNVEQPIKIVMNERVLGESMLKYIRTQERARGQ